MKNKFKGTGVALVTPFKKDLSVDFDAFAKLLDFTIDGGVDYLVVSGTTGESATTTPDEKNKILSSAIKHVKGRKPVVYGIGGNNTRAVIETIKNSDFNGVDAILSVSPYYNKPTQEGIYRHYSEIAENCPVPVILYNVPGRTSSNITAETTIRLARHHNIIGIKEASGDLGQCMQIVKNTCLRQGFGRQAADDFLVISGDDLLTVPMLSFGMDGVISVLANAFPKKFSKMVSLGLQGQFNFASKLLFDLLEINPLMYEESNPVGIKAALEVLGICNRTVRAPLIDASEGLVKKISKLLNA
ncbi:MAG: 4-hydroxy-tetrahydrodipicolinate synthase [Bacteroidetes bacterium]|nr:4-hydroxy-tetrahydrodipicolinate synthase [Bacteroidota bacterium]